MLRGLYLTDSWGKWVLESSLSSGSVTDKPRDMQDRTTPFLPGGLVGGQGLRLREVGSTCASTWLGLRVTDRQVLILCVCVFVSDRWVLLGVTDRQVVSVCVCV